MLTTRNSKPILLFLTAILLTAILLFSLPQTAPVGRATAQDASSADDFEIIFPDDNYVQLLSPTSSAMNDSHLVVADTANKRLFVKTDGAIKAYDMTFITDSDQTDAPKTEKIFLFGDTVLIVTENGCHTLDLTAQAPAFTPTEIFPLAHENYSFYSDGAYLYAKTLGGSVTRYGGAPFDGAGEKLTEDNAALTGKRVFAAFGDELYLYDLDESDLVLAVFNYKTSVETSYPVDGVMSKIAFNNDGSLLGTRKSDNGGTLCFIEIDRDGNAVNVTESGLSVRDFSLCGNAAAVITDKNTAEVHNVDFAAKTTSYSYSLSMNGADGEHLNNPSDLFVRDGSVYIADRGNGRIITIGENGTSINALYAPLHIADGADCIYASDGASLARANGDGGTTCAEFDFTAIDMTAANGIPYILSDDGVYAYIFGSTQKLGNVTARLIAGGENKSVIHLLQDGAIQSYYCGDGSLFAINAPLPVADSARIIDFKVDYAGNVYILYADRIEIFIAFGGAEPSTVIPLSHSELEFTPTALALGDDKLYFSAQESFIGAVSADVTDKDDFVSGELPDLNGAAISFILPADSENVWYYDVDGRPSTARPFNGGTIAEFDAFDVRGLRYVLIKDNSSTKLALINPSQFQTADPSAIAAQYVNANPTTLYSLPCDTDVDGLNVQRLALAENSIVSGVDDAAQAYNGEWIRVSVGGVTYFAKNADFTEYEEPVPEVERVFGRAKAARVGGTVKIYSAPDSSSAVAFEAVDGTRMEVLDTLDDYYMVTLDGKIGYISKAELELEGLTTVQIIAIVISVIVVLAGTVIFAAVIHAKKNEEKK